MLKFNKNPCSFYHFILNRKHGRLNNGPKDVRILIPKYVTIALCDKGDTEVVASFRVLN